MMDNCVNSIKQCLKLLKVKFSSSFVADHVLSHPHHPSLLSITDTLEKYKIDTLALKTDPKRLMTLPMPAILQVSKDKQEFFYVIEQVDTSNIVYYNKTNKKVIEKTKEFLKQWTGVCLLVQVNKDSKEVGVNKKTARSLVAIGKNLRSFNVSPF